MGSEWVLVRLGDHIDANLGKMLDAKKNKGSPQPYLGNSNVRWGTFDLDDLAEMRFESHEEERYGLIAGDLVVCEGGEPGRCAIWTGEIANMKIQKALHRIRPKATFHNYFLFYWFCHASKAGLLDPYFTGTTIKHLTGKAIADLKVPQPPIEQQSTMVDVLKSLDDRITFLRETNATLEAIAHAIFKSWFIDFDPVHAKARGEQPEGMSEEVAAHFPDSFEESTLGLVPKGWKIRSIGSVVQGIYDGPHATPPESDYGPIFLGIKNLTGTGIDYTDLRKISDRDYVTWTKRVTPQHGDIVFSYEATLGFFALIPEGMKCCLGRRLALIRPRNVQGNGHFWFHQLVAPVFQQLLVKHTIQGATVNRIALKQFPTYQVLDPSDPIKSVFNEIAQTIWRRIHLNQEQAQTLTTLRDTLLPRLISGQLRLPEAETAIAEAMK